MELFYSSETDGNIVRLDADESAHCVKVLRHRSGDSIQVIDGKGSLYRCTLTDDDPKAACARVEEIIRGFGSHPYHLEMAVCPTKNADRYEWFAEKATELGVDAIVPVIGDHSERKVFKTDRIRRIVLSAVKQSLKAAIPEVQEPVSVCDYLQAAPSAALRLICYCDSSLPRERRKSIAECLSKSDCDDIRILIGPEGDFSEEEVQLAFSLGWQPVHLGQSRLRTETAAVSAVAAVYFSNSQGF